MLMVTWLVTAFQQITQPQVWRTLGGMALCFSIISWLRAPGQNVWRVRLLMAAMMLAGIALALAAPFIVDWSLAAKTPIIPAAIYSNFHALMSDTVNTNVMAGALVLLLPLPLAQLLFGPHSESILQRMLAILSSVIIFVVLVLT